MANPLSVKEFIVEMEFGLSECASICGSMYLAANVRKQISEAKFPLPVRIPKMYYLAPNQTGLFNCMEASESDKMKRLRKGDRDVYEEVFSSHYTSLLLQARKILLDPASAEDMVHQVFLQLWEKKDKLHIRDSLTAYLHRSVRNACMNYLKHQKVEENYAASFLIKASEADVASSPSAHLIGEEQVKQLKIEIEGLPEKCGQVFRLSRFHSMSNKEIAEFLNISVRTVENQIYRALKILKDRMSNST